MLLRKTTVENSVRCIPKSEQTKEIKQNTIRKRKQNKNFSENSKKILKNVVASGFGVLTK